MWNDDANETMIVERNEHDGGELRRCNLISMSNGDGEGGKRDNGERRRCEDIYGFEGGKPDDVKCWRYGDAVKMTTTTK